MYICKHLKNQRKNWLLRTKDSVQFSCQSCLTLCEIMHCSTPSFPVHHQLPEHTQTHVHRVSDAIQASQHLSSPSPPTFNLSQHQGLFKWVSSSHQVAKVLEFHLQHQSLQWIFRTDFLLIFSLSKGLWTGFSNTTVQRINSLVFSFLYGPTLTYIHDYWKNNSFD